MSSLHTRFYLFLVVGGLLIWLIKIALENLYYTYWVYAREMPDYLPLGRVAVGIVVVAILGSMIAAAKPWRLLRK